MRNVEKLNPGDSVDHFFLIHRATQGVTAQGKDYMTLFLQDKSGDIEAKLWTATKDDMQTLKPETIVHVKGDIINYRGRKQMKIHQIRLAQAEDKVSTKDFVDGAPMSPSEIQEELSHFMLDIENANLQRITRHLIKKYQDRFFTYPAASSHHHNFASGLSYHVLTMLRIAKSICDIYPLLNRSLLYSAIILHDLGKVIELSGPMSTEYTLAGNLIGHLVLIDEEITKACLALKINEADEDVLVLR
ncbi:MAG: OB-fold nucleic acid binding domain-containing protein, partial [Staphylococcus epidermidis]|nr:OB-fold nucleic acid binding domain-containing protein [Staphylococcus epidermidis]